MKRLLNWLFPPPRDRRAEGYKFAKDQIKRGLRTEMENFVDAARLFGSFDDFDRGIEDALKDSEIP